MNQGQQSLWSFSSFQQDLVNPNTLNQVDAATKTFDEWYRVAKLYVQGKITKDDMLRCSSDFLYTATISNCPGKLFEIDMDSYVLSKLQNILCDFFNILQTKQKFQVLCQEPKFSSICNWIIQYLITPFYQSILNDRINIENRCEYIKTLTSLLNLGIFLTQRFPELYDFYLMNFIYSYSTSPFSFDPTPLTTLLVNPLEDSHLRDVGLKLLYSIHLVFKTQTLLAVSNTLRDRLMFTWLWTTDIFNQPSVLVALKMRIKFLAARDQHMLIEILHSIHDSLPNIFKDLNDQSITQILSIISLCEYKNDIDSDTINEYTSTYIALFQLFVSYFPHCEILFDYLSTNTSLSMMTYTSILSQSIEHFTNDIIYNFLLPYISEKLLLFKNDGVSGDENEQALIDFIHDLTISYLNRDNKSRDPVITKMIFMDCINSMRNGYIETERFPELCSKLLRLEYNSSYATTNEQSLSWLRLIFTDNQYDILRTRRAIKDMITLCIYNHLGGISGQETGNDTHTMDNNQINYSDPFIHQLFSVLTSICHRDIYYIWSDLLLENKYILNNTDPNSSIISVYEKCLLLNMNSYIKLIELQQFVVLATYESILTLCHSLSSVVSPSFTFLLFEIILRTTFCANKYLEEKIVCDDDLLTFILSRFPRTDSNINTNDIYYTSNDVIDICISICNDQTRQQLAYLFPIRFLQDKSTIVRKTALSCISNYPTIISQNARLIYEGILLGVQEEDKHIGIGELDLILSSCTSIYHLCLLNPIEYTPSLLSVLIKGIELSKENDTQNRPSSVIISYLNDIALNLNIKDIYVIMNSISSSLATKVCEYSETWFTLYERSKTNAQDYDAENTEYQTSLNHIQNLEQQGLYLDATRLCISLRNRVTDPSRKETLSIILANDLEHISATMLPQPDVLGNYVTESQVTLDVVNRWISIVMELQTLCPVEAENIMHISALYSFLANLYNTLSAPLVATTNSTVVNSGNASNVNQQFISCTPYDNNIIQSSLFQKLNEHQTV